MGKSSRGHNKKQTFLLLSIKQNLSCIPFEFFYQVIYILSNSLKPELKEQSHHIPTHYYQRNPVIQYLPGLKEGHTTEAHVFTINGCNKLPKTTRMPLKKCVQEEQKKRVIFRSANLPINEDEEKVGAVE